MNKHLYTSHHTKRGHQTEKTNNDIAPIRLIIYNILSESCSSFSYLFLYKHYLKKKKPILYFIKKVIK